MANWYEIAISITGGGALVKIFDFVRDTKKDSSEEIFKVLDEYKNMLNNMKLVDIDNKSMIAKNTTQIEELNIVISDLRSKVILLETASHDLPFPMWLKDMEFKMLYLNHEYEKLFLKPNGITTVDYIGKTDFDVWSVEIAESYMRSDKETIKSKNGVYIATNEIIIVGENNISEKYRVIKYLRYVGKIAIGIGGVAIPINE